MLTFARLIDPLGAHELIINLEVTVSFKQHKFRFTSVKCFWAVDAKNKPALFFVLPTQKTYHVSAY